MPRLQMRVPFVGCCNTCPLRRSAYRQAMQYMNQCRRSSVGLDSDEISVVCPTRESLIGGFRAARVHWVRRRFIYPSCRLSPTPYTCEQLGQTRLSNHVRVSLPAVCASRPSWTFVVLAQRKSAPLGPPVPAPRRHLRSSGDQWRFLGAEDTAVGIRRRDYRRVCGFRLLSQETTRCARATGLDAECHFSVTRWRWRWRSLKKRLNLGEI